MFPEGRGKWTTRNPTPSSNAGSLKSVITRWHHKGPQTQSDLLKFNERAAKILGMQKQHGLAVRADTRLFISQHPRAARFQLIAGIHNIVHLIADMVHTAIGMTLQKSPDR